MIYRFVFGYFFIEAPSKNVVTMAKRKVYRSIFHILISKCDLYVFWKSHKV